MLVPEVHENLYLRAIILLDLYSRLHDEDVIAKISISNLVAVELRDAELVELAEEMFVPSVIGEPVYVQRRIYLG